MFYTQNSFRVNVPLGIGETEQRPFNWNVRRLSFDCDAWERMCFALGQYFKHITEIKFSFAEPVFKKKYNHMFGFVYKSRDIGQLCPGPEGRVGNDDLDWNNDDKVGDAFYDTLDDMNFYEYDGMRFDGIYTVVPFDDVSEAMIRFTEFCPGEVKYIKLFWHWEMM